MSFASILLLLSSLVVADSQVPGVYSAILREVRADNPGRPVVLSESRSDAECMPHCTAGGERERHSETLVQQFRQASLIQATCRVPGAASAKSSWKSVRGAINALLVAYGIRSSKHETEAAVLARLEGADAALASWLRAVFATEWQSPPVARVVIQAVVDRLEREPGMPPLLASLRPRLIRSTTSLSHSTHS